MAGTGWRSASLGSQMRAASFVPSLSGMNTFSISVISSGNPLTSFMMVLILERSNLELDALGEWQRPRIIHRIGLPAHIGFPGVRPRLAPTARLLLAAERTANLRPRRPD